MSARPEPCTSSRPSLTGYEVCRTHGGDGSGAVRAEFAVLGRLHLVVFAAGCDQALEQHIEKPLALFAGGDQRIAHDAMFLLPSALGEVGEAVAFVAPFPPPWVVHRLRHVDQIAA